jgi:hypothetical protein
MARPEGGEEPKGGEIAKQTQFFCKKPNESASVSKKTNPIKPISKPIRANLNPLARVRAGWHHQTKSDLIKVNPTKHKPGSHEAS